MQTHNQRLAVKVFQQVDGLWKEGEATIREVLDSEGDETLKVKKKRKEIDVERKKYGAMAHKLPILIRTAGLAQAFGFLQAKADEPMNKRLLEDLASTLSLSSSQLLNQSRGESRNNTPPSLGDYMRLTQETLAALLWYKRFAQSLLGVDAVD